ncbi:siderophore-interacting protein [Veronia pacifica]|uniref:NADPH-dependent ferric siderophore reductase n=1 Tax=Veronia pacifica TaxID=1080227 RepID=A0A1C3EBI2_9GAMM|nr:siderophore-interacting protein [Veronia pacifica]ODA30603.1 NADPH-dependent ferric siderophore reductase [Veronia pacifica]
MSLPEPKLLTVVNAHSVTPNMQRITLKGEAIHDFPEECEGGYIKFLFNHQGGTDLDGYSYENRPVMRTYTIRRHDAVQGEIDIDFVHHDTTDESCGFASRWSKHASIGAHINILGPGLLQDLNPSADAFFLAADMTALPALSAKIKRLPENAQGYAVIKVKDEEDQQTLEHPAGVKVIWLKGTESLPSSVRALEWPAGKVSVWCACEFDDMRVLRSYFRNEKDVDRENIYISSYWKEGVTEDGHKVIKRQDVAEQEQSSKTTA